MSKILLAESVTLVIVYLFVCYRRAEAGSGYLIDPPARSSMWRLPQFSNAPKNYDDMSIDCGSGGAQWTQFNAINQGRCGPCGDEWSIPQPRPNEEGGEYGLGIIAKTYKAESVINMTVNLMTSMLGYFVFRLCAYKKSAKELVTWECFDRHLLTLADGSGTRYPIPANQDNTIQIVSLKLPDGNVNCEFCVIQWRYYTGNSWGVCSNGSSGLGCGDQAEFRNCADVTILPLETAGYLADPPSRASFEKSPGYTSLDCGGQWAQYDDVNNGRCGICGDEWRIPQPRPNEEGGELGLGIIGNTYRAESVVNMTINLTLPSMTGYFEFHLCAYKKSDKEVVVQECLDRHLLALADGSGTRYQIQRSQENSVHTVSLKLPDGNVNCEFCVIQWFYRTAHQSWGTCEDGTFAMGCGDQQQELRNCADVTILPLETAGYLADPPSRASFDKLPGYMSLDCGGQWAQYNDANNGRCGPCGDEWLLPQPRPNEEGGANALGIIGKRYTTGYIVELTVLLTKNYPGYFEFRLCADKEEANELVTQDCFDRHLLKFEDGSTRYLVSENSTSTYHNISLQLPKAGELDCKNCVIQWIYRTAHKSWGTCENGIFAMGCGYQQQELRNCADVTINPPPLTETPQGFLFFDTQYLPFYN